MKRKLDSCFLNGYRVSVSDSLKGKNDWVPKLISFYSFFCVEGVPKIWSKGIGLGLITLVVSGVRISSSSYKILLLLLFFFRFNLKQNF